MIEYEIVIEDRRDVDAIREALAKRNPDGTVPHVRCEGARFHVLWWSSKGRHCTEPACVVNRASDTREP